MTKFTLVAGSGHCGTLWLATVLDSQRPNEIGLSVTAHHELRQHLAPGPWYQAVQYHVDDEVNRAYFARIRSDLQYGDVFDGVSWGVHEFPDVAKHIRVDHILYLVRHPILQLHSIWTGSQTWNSIPEDHFLYATWLRRAWQMDPVDPYYFDRDRWGKLCEIVRANVHGPHFLRKQGLRVLVYRLETLVKNVDILREVAPGLSVEQARAWQRRDINRKVRGNRDPAYVWNQWTPAMRDTFKQLCGEAMDVYGYAWPLPEEVPA